MAKKKTKKPQPQERPPDGSPEAFLDFYAEQLAEMLFASVAKEKKSDQTSINTPGSLTDSLNK